MDTDGHGPGRRIAAWAFAGLAVYQVALGLYFLVGRPAVLPEDLRFMQLSVVLGPQAHWLRLVFAVLGGQMMAVGLLLAPLAADLWRGKRLQRLSWAAIAAAGLASAVLMSAVNFTLMSDFRWLLLAPPVLWALAVASLLRAR